MTSFRICKGEVLDELRELASRVPFDERGNPDIRLEDISTLLLREYLVKVGSKLASEINIRPLQEILEQMDLFVGPKENRMLRNVAAMMFCENPSKFFKRTHLKELDMTEGRSTGIPTIQNVLENNGSPRATVVTDEDRTFFRITIPCHEAAGNIIADIVHKDASVKASRRGARKSGLQSTPESGLQSTPESTLKIIEQIQNNPQITMTEIANVTGYSRSWVAKTIKRLQEQNIIKHIGSNKNGYWEIITK